jgi:hypothetical protein
MHKDSLHDRDGLTKLAVDTLNSAFLADPNAMHALVCNRVPCNQQLADHPTVVVDENRTLGADGCATVGALGLLNGVLVAIGLPLVVAKFVEADEDWQEIYGARRRFAGFTVYSPPDSAPK